MKRYENTHLWQRTLAAQLEPDLEAANRQRLRAAYDSFRDRAAMLAGEIAIDLPEFTVHDVTHLDALWEMAQLITGERFPLNPAEAFVLGGAFLIHDLGMGLAAYPEGISKLQETALWADNVTARFKSEFGRRPSELELNNPPSHIKTQVMRQLLRELHARHAERLGLISWRDHHNGSSEYFLIDDPALRATYGPIIGKIAHSHWWPVELLTQRLPTEMGAPGGFCNSWTVDPIKLACILRAADASHLDERRAPGFLTALRKPVGVSATHWRFQEKLYQPRIESDRLVYTAKSAFSLDEASSWWACFDAIQVVDRELRQIDSLLADTNRPRLTAKGVSYADDPIRMAKLIGTSDWLPVDARIKVGNVAKLVSTLGGESLYGRNELVPLRELIQNASDALRARRILERRSDDWGGVTVRVGEDTEGQWLEVEDCGIGMSIDVLIGPFLDFGSSFWGTPLMHQQLPGLESKGFTPSGQFGIGFYSVFMWGERVRITTRRAESARENTLVLEFHNGLDSRPILRQAYADESLIDGGTKVRVWFRKPEILKRLISGSNPSKRWTLEDRCAWLSPALDTNLYVEQKTKKLVIGASDWVSIKGSKLLQRIWGPCSKDDKDERATLFTKLEKNLRLLTNSSGEIVGRACISPRERLARRGREDDSFVRSGVVAVGGFRSSALTGINGILLGSPHTAARNVGVPLADSLSLQSWATEQATLGCWTSISSDDQTEVAEIVAALGGETRQLLIAETSQGWRNTDDLSHSKFGDEVFIVQDAALSNARRAHGEISIHPNVISVATGRPGILQTGQHNVRVYWPPKGKVEADWDDHWRFHSRTLQGAVMKAIAKAWNIPLTKMMDASEASTDEKSIEREIGTCNGKPFFLDVDVLRKG